MANSKKKEDLITQIKKLERKIISLESKNFLPPSYKVIFPNNIKLNSFYKNSLNIITVVDRKGCIIDVNRVVKGLQKKDIIGLCAYDFIIKESQAFLKKNVEQAFKTKKPVKYKISGYGSNGSLAYYSSIAIPIIENGNAVAVVIDSIDITNETKAKEELQRSEEKFKKLSDSAFEGIFIHQNGKVINVNKAVTKIFNYTEKEAIGKPIFDFIDQSYHQKVIDKIKKKHEKPYEALALRKGKKTFWGEFVAREINIGGQIARVVAVRDITKQKEYQEQIQKSQYLYKKIIDASPDGVLIHQHGKILFVNPSAIKLMEAPKSYNFLGKDIFNFLLPEYANEIKKRMSLINKNTTVPPIDVKLKTIKGKIKTIEIRSFLTEYSGSPAIQVMFRDQSIQKQLLTQQIKVQVAEELNQLLQKEIDERKIAEEQMHKQSAKLNAIFESSNHIIWTVDENGGLRTFNKNFEKYFYKHYKVKIKIGMSILDENTISTHEYNNFWKKKINLAYKGAPQHFESQLINHNGESWIEMFLNPIYDSSGELWAVAGIGHDITSKKESEELIAQSLQEKEILLKEVHHRVKNNLQLVSSILNLQSSYVKDEKILDVLKDSQNRIKSMSFIHESLYQTKDFSSINFTEYATQLSNNLVHSYSNYDGDVKLKLDIQNVFLNLDLAIPSGLIINEILSNALKYAFAEKAVKKELRVKIVVDGENIKLMIGDNGKGLPKGIDFKNTDSLGLQIVTTLVEQLRGTIELDTKKIGTNYIVKFKYNQTKQKK